MFVEGDIENQMRQQVAVSPGNSAQLDPTIQLCSAGIAEVNVINANDILVGNKIINVTGDNAQTVKDSQVELISKTNSNSNSRTIRCNCAVYACLATVILVGILAFVMKAILSVKLDRIDIGISESWFLRKQQWQAIHPSNVTFLSTPISNLIIFHTGTSHCNQLNSCIRLIKRIQAQHMTMDMYPDIGFNYLVGGGGLVFEGCGGNIVGNFLAGWNDRAISVAFMGNYTIGKDEPDNEQFENLEIVLARLVERQVLISNYKVLGVCQITKAINPGGNIMRNMSSWKAWLDIDLPLVLHNDRSCATCISIGFRPPD